MIWFLLLSFVTKSIMIDQVDIAELNHIICPTNGNVQGSYWVWWKWQIVDGHADYYVCDWRKRSSVPMPKDGVQEFQDEMRNNVRGFNRRVESKIFQETWTYYDRESEDRKRLPESKRRKLRIEK